MNETNQIGAGLFSSGFNPSLKDSSAKGSFVLFGIPQLTKCEGDYQPAR